MTTTGASPSNVGWVAIAAGVAGLLGIVFIILFFTVGGPFGTLADYSNGLLAILSAVLALTLYPQFRALPPFACLVAPVLALSGAVIASYGSALVISGRTGWFLAGTYTAVGFGLIGLWLVGLNAAVLQGSAWPRRSAVAGIVVGLLMALGLAAIPGIINGVDAQALAPWYVSYVGVGLSSLGWFVLYPIWCLLLGRILLFR